MERLSEDLRAAEIARHRENLEAWLWAVAIVTVACVVIFYSVTGWAGEGSSLPTAAPTDWQAQMLELAGAALLAALTWASAALKAYFTAHAKGAVGNYALGVYQRLDDAVVTAVTAVEQATLRDLAAGLSKKSAEQAKADAIAYAKTYLGPKGLAELAEIVGLSNVANILSGKIESAVLAVNAGGAAAPVEGGK